MTESSKQVKLSDYGDMFGLGELPDSRAGCLFRGGQRTGESGKIRANAFLTASECCQSSEIKLYFNICQYIYQKKQWSQDLVMI